MYRRSRSKAVTTYRSGIWCAKVLRVENARPNIRSSCGMESRWSCIEMERNIYLITRRYGYICFGKVTLECELLSIVICPCFQRRVYGLSNPDVRKRLDELFLQGFRKPNHIYEEIKKEFPDFEFHNKQLTNMLYHMGKRYKVCRVQGYLYQLYPRIYS